MTHLRPDELSATLDGALEGAARERAERHLAECASCREALAALRAQDAGLRASLEHDPGEAYFETFAARVEDRIRAAGLTGAQSRLGREGGWGWLSSPRRLAWLGTAAVIVVGAAIVMISGQPERSLLQKPEILDRVEPSREAAPEAPRTMKAIDRADEDALAKKDAQRPVAKSEGAASGLAESERQDEIRAELRESSAPAAPSTRAREVRRNAAGEDVPVAKSLPSAPAPAPPTTSAEADVRMAKPGAAPMESKATAQSIAPQSRDLAQAGSLCGRVLDNRQQPVPGATVALADRGTSATAGPDGRFCLDAPQGLHELSVMAVGYQPTRLQVRVEGPTSEALVTLRAVSALDAAGGLALQGGRAGEATFSTDGVKSLFRVGASPTSQAQARTAKAESLGTAAAWEDAAAAWTAVVAATRGDARIDARYRLAQARFEAWRIAPTASRARAARAAVAAFLAATPAGTRRDQAATWKRELSR